MINLLLAIVESWMHLKYYVRASTVIGIAIVLIAGGVLLYMQYVSDGDEDVATNMPLQA